jgi:hypothetical protein
MAFSNYIFLLRLFIYNRFHFLLEKETRGRHFFRKDRIKFSYVNDLYVDTERGVNQYQVQFKTFFNLYLNHSTISNEQ